MAEANKQLVTTQMDKFKQMIYDPKFSEALSRALPKHIGPERMIQIALTALTQNPLLIECEPKSLLRAVIQSSILGLEPDTPLGQSYLVPFAKKVQLIVGYRGFIALAYRTGMIDSISAHPVYENDLFKVVKGSHPEIIHEEYTEGERGEVTGYYSVIHLTNSRWPLIDFMLPSEIEKIKARSKSAKSPYSPWNTDPIEMGRKTVLKRNMKYAPLSIEMGHAMAIDADADMGRTQRIPAEGFEVLNEDEETHEGAREVKEKLGLEDDEGTASGVEEEAT